MLLLNIGLGFLSTAPPGSYTGSSSSNVGTPIPPPAVVVPPVTVPTPPPTTYVSLAAVQNSVATPLPAITVSANTTNNANLSNVGNVTNTQDNKAYSGGNAGGFTPPSPIDPTGQPWAQLPGAPTVAGPSPFTPVPSGLSPITPLGPMAAGGIPPGLLGGGGQQQPGAPVMPQQMQSGNQPGAPPMSFAPQPGGAGQPMPARPPLPGQPTGGPPVMRMPGGAPMRVNPGMMGAQPGPVARAQAAGNPLIASNPFVPPPPAEMAGLTNGQENQPPNYFPEGGNGQPDQVPGASPYADLARAADPEMALLDQSIQGGREAIAREAQKYGEKAIEIVDSLPTKEAEAVAKAVEPFHDDITAAKEEAIQAHGRMRLISNRANNLENQMAVRAGIERDAYSRFPDPPMPVHWNARPAFTGARGYFANAQRVNAIEHFGYDPMAKNAFDLNAKQQEQYQTNQRMTQVARAQYVNSQLLRYQNSVNGDWAHARSEAQDAQKTLSGLERERDKAAKEARITALSQAQRQIAGISTAMRGEGIRRGVLDNQATGMDKKIGRVIGAENARTRAITADTGIHRENRMTKEGGEKHDLAVKKDTREASKLKADQAVQQDKGLNAKDNRFRLDRKAGIATSHQAFDLAVDKGDMPKSLPGSNKAVTADQWEKSYKLLKDHPEYEERLQNLGINTAKLRRIGDSANER